MTSKPVKWRRILEVLVRGERLNRFQAARLGDSCLNSTICDIENHGVPVKRRAIKLPGYNGLPVRCNEYWIASADIELARRVLRGPR